MPAKPRVKIEFPKALLLTLVNPSSKKRVERNIHLILAKGYSVDVICPYKPSIIGVATHMLQPQILAVGESGSKWDLLKLYLHQIALGILTAVFGKDMGMRYAFSMSGYDLTVVTTLFPESFDLIVVEEIELLPIAMAMKDDKTTIVMDLRDFYWRDDTVPSHFALNPFTMLLNNLAWAHHVLRKSIYQMHLPHADQILTVCEGHANQLRELFSTKAVVFRSMVPYHPEMRPRMRSGKEPIRLVYHGAAYERRGLDLLIDAVNQASEKIRLHLYLTDPDEGYLDQLKRRACDRVAFHEPVHYDRLVETMNRYDVGIIFYPPYDSSLEHSLPNKFFEFIQSRLVIVTGPSLDMGQIIRTHGIGTVTDGFSTNDLIRCLNGLDQKMINVWKQNADVAAKTLSFEHESKKLLNLI